MVNTMDTQPFEGTGASPPVTPASEHRREGGR